MTVEQLRNLLAGAKEEVRNLEAQIANEDNLCPGDRFLNKESGDKYILSAIGCGTYALINLRTGMARAGLKTSKIGAFGRDYTTFEKIQIS